MKKFSKNKKNYNPYNSSTFKSKVYEKAINTLKSNKGKIAGLEELCEKIDDLQKNEVTKKYISLLKEKRNITNKK